MKKITKKQADAFSQVIKAIEKMHKTGLVLFGKQFDLVAMTKDTAIYESDNDLLCKRGNGSNDLEILSASVLWDSGADDYCQYKEDTDDPYKGEFQDTPTIYSYHKNYA